MANVIPAPTLTVDGWVREPSAKADALIADFFASDANQTFLYLGAISNLPDLLKRYAHDITGLKAGLRDALEAYMGRYYQQAQFEVWDDTATNNTNRIGLYISGTVVDAGVTYNFSNLLTLVNDKFEKITKINNTGTT